MVCGHGSRDVDAVAEFQRLVARLAGRLPHYAVESGFLEFARPILREGLDRLRAQRRRPRPRRAGHAVRRRPRQERRALGAQRLRRRARHAGSTSAAISASTPSCSRPRATASTRRSPAASRGVPRAETLLAVVGRGTSDPDANGNVAKVARMLWEGMGFGWAEIGYSGVAHPRVDALLERAVRLGFRRIVVFPYFLFTGVLVRRIYAPGRRGRGAASRDRVRQGGLSQRPPAGARDLRRAHRRHPRRRRQHELPAVQVPRPADRLRGGGRRAAAGPPPSRRGHRHRRRSSPSSSPPPRSSPTSIPTPRRGPTRRRRRARGSRAMATLRGDYRCAIPAAIYRASFAAIRREAPLDRLPARDRSPWPLRLIHACGMTDILDDLAWTPVRSPPAARALAAGAPSWSMRRWSRPASARDRLPAGNRSSARCATRASPSARPRARPPAPPPRSICGGTALAGAVVAIGNAPTALFRLLELLAAGARPAGAGARLPGRLRRRGRGQGGADRAAACACPTSRCAAGAAAARWRRRRSTRWPWRRRESRARPEPNPGSASSASARTGSPRSSPAARAAGRAAEMLVGGARHLAMVPGHPAERLTWRRPLEDTIEDLAARRGRRVVVLASGDPMWFGVGELLRAPFRRRRDARRCRQPSAFSLACARLGWPLVEVDGAEPARPAARELLRRYLAPGARLSCSADDGDTPDAIAGAARRAAAGARAGCGSSSIWAAPRERCRMGTAATWAAGALRRPQHGRDRLRRRRPAPHPCRASPGCPTTPSSIDGQLTKREVRAVTLARLAPLPGQRLWDVGAGCGSIAIEWLRAAPARARRSRSSATPARCAHDRAQRRARSARPSSQIVQAQRPRRSPGCRRPMRSSSAAASPSPALLDACWQALPPGRPAGRQRRQLRRRARAARLAGAAWRRAGPHRGRRARAARRPSCLAPAAAGDPARRAQAVTARGRLHRHRRRPRRSRAADAEGAALTARGAGGRLSVGRGRRQLRARSIAAAAPARRRSARSPSRLPMQPVPRAGRRPPMTRARRGSAPSSSRAATSPCCARAIPLLYGCFASCWPRWSTAIAVEIVPGVSSLTAAAAAAATPLVAAATRRSSWSRRPCRARRCARRLAGSDAAAILKLGRHLPKLRRVLSELGLLERAIYVEHASRPSSERRCRSPTVDRAEVPYFALVLRAAGARRVTT